MQHVVLLLWSMMTTILLKHERWMQRLAINLTSSAPLLVCWACEEVGQKLQRPLLLPQCGLHPTGLTCPLTAQGCLVYPHCCAHCQHSPGPWASEGGP
jgi:hypothetical protein